MLGQGSGRWFGVAVAAVLAGGCGPSVGSDGDESLDAGGTTNAATTTADASVTGGADASTSVGGGSASTGAEVDPQLETIADLRSTLDRSEECLDLRKLGATSHGPKVVVIVDIPPSNMAEPQDEVAQRTYTLPDDAADLQMRAFIVDELYEHDCEVVPTEGTRFDATAGTFDVRYDVVDQGCGFTCERLFVEISDLVMQRESDGATVDVGTLYIPSWIDPSPPD